MFLSILIVVNLSTAQLKVEHPELNVKTEVVVGKPATPTPEGMYLVSKATNPKLGRLLVFRKEDKAVWAIHENLASRTVQLASRALDDNYLSNGCIGVTKETMDKLWSTNQTIVLQVY